MEGEAVMLAPSLFAVLLAAEPPSRFLPPPEVRAFFEAARETRQSALPAPERRAGDLEDLEPLERPLEARVEAWVDDAVRVSWPISPAQRALLRRRRVPVVTREAAIAEEAIFEGRLHRLLRVSPDLRGPAGAALFTRLLGQEATLLLGRARDGHVEVLSAR
jgi:hypothetical protein